jgi:hypothetical protein
MKENEIFDHEFIQNNPLYRKSKWKHLVIDEYELLNKRIDELETKIYFMDKKIRTLIKMLTRIGYLIEGKK